MSEKIRNKPMEESSQGFCLAKNRQGNPCKRYKAVGKNRCYMHGGAKGSGGQVGNQNALKHGMYTKEALESRAMVTRYFRQFKELQKEFDL